MKTRRRHWVYALVATLACMLLVRAAFSVARRRRVEGLAAPSAAIINGTPATWSAFPFYCAVQRVRRTIGIATGGYYGGGVVVNSRFVLTVAHFLKNQSPADLWVQTYPGTKLFVEKVWIHPQYKGSGAPYDIAVLKLAQHTTSPVIKITNADPRNGAKVTIIGRGKTTDSTSDDTFKSPMFQTTLTKTSGAGGVITVTDTGRTQADISGTCLGDSGGPLIARTTAGLWVLVGLSSQSDALIDGKCIGRQLPNGIYIRSAFAPSLVNHRAWIAQIMAQDMMCQKLYGPTASWKEDKNACGRPATRTINGRGGPIQQTYLQTCTQAKGCV